MDRISTFLAMMLVAIMLATLPDVPAQEKVEKGPVPLPADFTTRVFTHRLEGSPTAYIKTDLQISPVLTVPKAAYCVGERVVPAISINSDWYSSVFEAEIRSNANVLSCVVPCTILNRDQPIVWITNADFQAIVDENLYGTFGSVEEWRAFLSLLGIKVAGSLEKAKYLTAEGTTFGRSEDYHAVDVSVYAKGRVRMLSSNPCYDRMVSEQFDGNIPAIPAIILSEPGTFSFRLEVELSGAFACGQSYMQGGCAGLENVHIYTDTSISSIRFQSPPVTIRVDPPFSCKFATRTPSILPAYPTSGSQISLSFDLANNANHDVIVKSISLEDNSHFSDLSDILPSIPFAVAAGGEVSVRCVLRAPGTAGTYPLRLSIHSEATAEDCSGRTKGCNVERLYVTSKNFER